jgi:hypothetical protein
MVSGFATSHRRTSAPDRGASSRTERISAMANSFPSGLNAAVGARLLTCPGSPQRRERARAGRGRSNLPWHRRRGHDASFGRPATGREALLIRTCPSLPWFPVYETRHQAAERSATAVAREAGRQGHELEAFPMAEDCTRVSRNTGGSERPPVAILDACASGRRAMRFRTGFLVADRYLVREDCKSLAERIPEQYRSVLSPS